MTSIRTRDVGLLALLAALAGAACTGEIGGPKGTLGGGPGIDPGGTGCPTTTGGGSGTGGSGTTSGGGPLVESPSPRFIRQLTLGEYQRTVVDLLQIANPDTTSIPPDVAMKGFTT